MYWVTIIFVLLYLSNTSFCIAIYLQPLIPVDEIEHDDSPPITYGDLLEMRSQLEREMRRRAFADHLVRVQRAMSDPVESAQTNKRARIGGNIVMGR